MIVAEQLTKYYGDRAAVTGIDFTIRDGEVVGLLGLNGAGKTTILKILSGLLLPTSGRVTVAGLSMAEQPEQARARIGFLPEQPPLYPEMTVNGYLQFVAHIKSFTGDIDAAITEATAAADLSYVRDHVIATLSNGFQRRVGIAQAIIHKPALILLDEPTSGLDPVQVVQMRDLIRGLRGKNTIMLSSHNLHEIKEVCDRILVIKDGQIAAEGTEAELGKRVTTATKLSVEVRAAAGAFREAMAKAKNVAHFEINTEKDGVTTATVELAKDCREELAKTLVDAGFGLRRFERIELELESIFLELTRKEVQS